MNSTLFVPLDIMTFCTDHNNTDHNNVTNKIYHMKKVLKERQTLGTGCSNVEPKIFAPPQTPFPGGMGWPKFNQLEMVTTFTYKPSLVRICTQFRVIVVTDPQRHTSTISLSVWIRYRNVTDRRAADTDRHWLTPKTTLTHSVTR